jgi:sulfate adenylyltransferase subunit 1 (EFTu-like GTPase family)
MLVWMDEKDMDKDMQFFIKHANNSTCAFVTGIDYRVDVNTLEHFSVDFFKLNDIGKVQVTTNKPLFFDPYKRNKITGSFILIDPITNNTAAVGMIIGKSKNAESRTITAKGQLHKVANAEEAENKYRELKLKGRTAIRLDATALKTKFTDLPNEKITQGFVEMLLSEGVDVIW